MSVISLNGGTVVHNPSEPDPLLVKRLEETLELAKSGQIIGAAIAIQYFDGAGSSTYIGRCSRNTVGWLFKLMTKISADIDGVQ